MQLAYERMDLRWGGIDINRIRALAQELVGLQPDIILAGSFTMTVALQRETRTIPIVFAAVSDPVAQRIVPRLDATSGDGATGNPARRRQRRAWYHLTARPDEKRFLYSEEPIARITVLISHLVKDDGEHHAKHNCEGAAEGRHVLVALCFDAGGYFARSISRTSTEF
jgi:hypothetical protein